jgi:hypothetical protein
VELLHSLAKNLYLNDELGKSIKNISRRGSNAFGAKIGKAPRRCLKWRLSLSRRSRSIMAIWAGAFIAIVISSWRRGGNYPRKRSSRKIPIGNKYPLERIIPGLISGMPRTNATSSFFSLTNATSSFFSLSCKRVVISPRVKPKRMIKCSRFESKHR